MISKKLIKVSEYYKFLISLKEDERFSIQEIEILESFPVIFRIYQDIL